MKIGERLRQVRKHNNLTQEVVCEKLRKGHYYCEIDATCLSRYERDQRTQELSFIKAFCECFNVNCDWLVCGKGDIFRVSQPPKDAKTIFLELSGLIQDTIMPQPELPNYLPVDFEQMEQNISGKYLLLLAYMLKDVQIRRSVFLNFYFYAKYNQAEQV